MGCMEAMCESWMAALGKAHADKQVRSRDRLSTHMDASPLDHILTASNHPSHAKRQNLVLLDCIQRTGMSAHDTGGCFARADVASSPLRQGLYQCAVCRACLSVDAKDKNKMCQDYQASASSAGQNKGGGGGAAPSASEWQQYVPKKYMPGGGMLRTPTGWF